VSRVFFHPARADAAPGVVADAAWDLCARVLDDAGLADGATLAHLIDRQPRRRAESQFRGWTEALPDRLRERGLAPTPLAPIDAPEEDAVEVTVPDGALPVVSLSRTAHTAAGLLLCRRPACHPVSGLDGALAGLAYASVSAEGKRSLQAGLQPRVERSVCGGCGMCVSLCDRDGIRYNGHVSQIQPANCLVCGDCRLECTTQALKFPPLASVAVQKRMAAVAAAALNARPGRLVCLLFLLDEPERHGVNLGRRGAWPDLGILAGSDPVALDVAVRQLIVRETGRRLQDWSGGEDDPGVIIEEAARLGVGDAACDLVELSP